MFTQGIDFEITDRAPSWNVFKRRYVLLKDYEFQFGSTVFEVPAGYEWDGPSGVPIWGMFGYGWLEPSLVHDYLYETREGHNFTRHEVDQRFFDDLKDNGFSTLFLWFVDLVFDPAFKGSWDETEDMFSPRVFKGYILTGFILWVLIMIGLGLLG